VYGSIADQAVAELEMSDAPLAYWDVKRALDQHASPHEHRPATVNQALANDLRACWAGRGIYGLYRHGLLPGVRDLGRTAAVYIHAADRGFTFDELYFTLRDIGYRFSPNSLQPALWRVDDLGIFRNTGGWNDGEWKVQWRGERDNVVAERAVARAMCFERRGRTLYSVLDRAAGQVDAALAERQRRLG
jgi:hypothetical protein